MGTFQRCRSKQAEAGWYVGQRFAFQGVKQQVLKQSGKSWPQLLALSDPSGVLTNKIKRDNNLCGAKEQLIALLIFQTLEIRKTTDLDPMLFCPH